MNSITKKLTSSLSQLHNKEAEQYNLITGDFLTYRVGNSFIVGNEVIVPEIGRYRLSSSALNANKKDIGLHYFSYLQSALTYSVAQQRGWLNICLLVKDSDSRLANAEHDIDVFSIRAKSALEHNKFDKNAIYVARLSAAKSRYAKAKAELAILSKKAKYINSPGPNHATNRNRSQR
jgi:hypothetical protein